MRFLESPRRRRRLLMTAIPIAIAAPLIYLGVHYSTPGNPENATGGKIDTSFYSEPKHVRFTPKNQRAVRKVLARFVETAVARRNVGAAWDLAGPSLRVGTTYADWRKGDIPVVPYPAAKHGQGTWSYVEFSHRNRVGLEVVLFPKPRSGYSMATASAEVQRGRDGRWRVDYWMLEKFHGPAATAPADSASALGEGPPNVHKLPGKKEGANTQASRSAAHKAAAPAKRKTAAPEIGPKPLDRKWLILPFAVLSLIIIVPVVVGTSVWIRNRRAEAAFKRSH
jgi:hypothetical protein